MLGAIVGDIVGSVHEFHPAPPEDFELFAMAASFTDDTVHCVAIAEVLLDGGDYASSLRKWSRRYPGAGYGMMFASWMALDDAPAYGSYGNGSAMRVAPVGWAVDGLDAVLAEAKRSAEVTHSHAEGIRGAQAIAGSIHLARNGATKRDLLEFVSGRIRYDCSPTLAERRPRHRMDETCNGTVPVAITAVLESHDFESALRNAVGMGGDADTLGCIAGALAEALYGGVPRSIRETALTRLTPDLRAVVDRFCERYPVPQP